MAQEHSSPFLQQFIYLNSLKIIDKIHEHNGYFYWGEGDFLGFPYKLRVLAGKDFIFFTDSFSLDVCSFITEALMHKRFEHQGIERWSVLIYLNHPDTSLHNL